MCDPWRFAVRRKSFPAERTYQTQSFPAERTYFDNHPRLEPDGICSHAVCDISSRIGVRIRISVCTPDVVAASSITHPEQSLHSVELNKTSFFKCDHSEVGFLSPRFIRFPGLSEPRNPGIVVWHRRCSASSHPVTSSISNGIRLCHLPSDRRPLWVSAFSCTQRVVVSGLSQFNGKPVSRCKSWLRSWRHRLAQPCRLMREPSCCRKC